MSKYVVAYLSMFDGKILQEIVEASSALEAGKSYLDSEGLEHITDLNGLYDYVYNLDCYMHVLPLVSRTRSSEPTSIHATVH